MKKGHGRFIYMSANVLENLSRLICDLTKTIKAVSVYPEDNPLPLKMKETFNEHFTDFIKEVGGLRLEIGPNEIRYKGEVAYKDPEEEESLAAFFHNSGITDISFSLDFDFK
ncbi:MAG: hypothetical protein JSV44_01450, partial [Candidatus Zixiibacteriota bacterium]